VTICYLLVFAFFEQTLINDYAFYYFMVNQVTLLKKKLLPILKRNDVKKAGVFGSYARDEAKKNSDVDLLVDLGKNKSLLDLIRLKQEIEFELSKKADLVTYNSINKHIKESILLEEVQIL